MVKKIYCVISGKYRKFEKPKIKISHLLQRKLVLFYFLLWVQEWKWKIIQRKRINWDIKNI